MKANELMVGDYLMHNGFPYRVIQVDGIVRDGWMIENGEEDCGEPIPLTIEILEKNGFKYKEGETGMYGVTIAPHYICDGIPFEVFCDGEPFAIWFKEPINIKYVHQLQHALRLCGINHEIIL